MTNYPEIENLIKIAKILDELIIPYYVTGGFAVSIYGRPRFTADIDIIIKMSHLNSGEFAIRMKRLFPSGYVDEDQIKNALSRFGEFNIIDPESGLKIDFFIAKKNEFEKECFKNIKKEDVGYKTNFISAEDLIISKLIWFQQSESTKQLEDIVSIIDVQKKLDQDYLNLWIKKLGLQKKWQKIEDILAKKEKL